MQSSLFIGLETLLNKIENRNYVRQWLENIFESELSWHIAGQISSHLFLFPIMENLYRNSAGQFWISFVVVVLLCYRLSGVLPSLLSFVVSKCWR